MTIPHERWFWCELCNHQAIMCSYCNCSSCSGGSCDICYDEFEEAISEKNPPAKESIPFRPDGMKFLLDEWDKGTRDLDKFEQKYKKLMEECNKNKTAEIK